MNYFGKIISNISQAYSEINPATLTGAIDVIIVEQEDGSYRCSPFHVRFGKMGVLRSKEKIVDIEINGVPVDIHMKLGDSGEAYFLEECSDVEEDNVECDPDKTENDEDEDDATQSCNISNVHSLESLELDLQNLSQPTGSCDTTNLDVPISEDATNQSVKPSHVETNSSQPAQEKMSQKRTRRKKKSKLSNGKQSMRHNESSSSLQAVTSEKSSVEVSSEDMPSSPYSESELHPFSDSEISQCKHKLDSFSDSFDCKSDSEYEIYKSNDKTQGQDNISWGWGELPNVQKEVTQSAKKDSENKAKQSPRSSMLGGVLNFMIKDKDKPDDDTGIYLDELDPNDMNPEVAAKYFPKFHRSSLTSKPNNFTSSDEDLESGNGPSLSNSPQSVDYHYLNQSEFSSEFDEKLLINYDLASIGKLYHDMSMSLCGRIEDLISNPTDSERFLQSIISFDDFSENPLEILDNHNLVIRMGGKYYTWKMASAILLSLLMFQRPLSDKTMAMIKDKCIPKKSISQSNSKSSWRSWFRSNASDANLGEENPNELGTEASQSGHEMANTSTDNSVFNSSLENSHTSNKSSSTLEYISDDETLSLLISNKNSTSGQNGEGANKKTKYRKVLRLNSDVIKDLNLRPGSNDVMFSVTTAYQGTTICKSKIFLWSYNDKVIISDIDGTITKSDVLGHILPYIGKDWAQMGVTKLYSNIECNGYKFLYLSARAIGQAKGTREYLGSIRQEGICLPDGPLLLSPTSLFSALHREVIEKKPEEFKISCLKDIQTLFPSNPFFAGFGNKINDNWAYRAVKIDSSRIFTINHKGELKLEKIMSFKSTYTDLSQFVDQMFPPVQEQTNDDFSSFMYWRSEIPQLSEQDLTETK